MTAVMRRAEAILQAWMRMRSSMRLSRVEQRTNQHGFESLKGLRKKVKKRKGKRRGGRFLLPCELASALPSSNPSDTSQRVEAASL